MIARMHVARLACARDNQPYIVPIHVDLEGEHLYGYASEGLKIEWMRQNPMVCLEIDELSSQTHWASVVMFGRYEELPHVPEYEDLRRIAERLFQRHPMWWQPSSVPLAGHELRSSVVFRIRIERVTGRRGSRDAAEPADGRKAPPEVERPRGSAPHLRGVSWKQ